MSVVKYYILVDPDKPNKCKLGITKNEKQRIRAYRTAAPQCYYYSIYDNVEKIHEKKILDLLKDRFIVDREYIHCHPKIVQRIIEGYFTDKDIDFCIVKNLDS